MEQESKLVEVNEEVKETLTYEDAFSKLKKFILDEKSKVASETNQEEAK